MTSPDKLKYNIEKHFPKRDFPHGNGHDKAVESFIKHHEITNDITHQTSVSARNFAKKFTK